MSVIVARLLAEAQRRRVRVWTDAGTVRFDGPRSALDDRFVTLLREQRDRIRDHLERHGDRWLRPLTDGAGESLVFLLPAAGTGPGRYRVWRAAPAGLDVVAVHLPGREERFDEAPVRTVGPLADELAALLPRYAEGRRFTIFGHSNGAGIGYEVATRLRGHTGLRLLAVAGAAPPDLVSTEAGDIPDDELVVWMAQLSDTGPDLLAGKDVADAFLPSLRADLAVHASCHREHNADAVLDVPILALAGDRDPATDDGRTMLWERWTSKGFTHRTVPGGHFFPVTESRQVLGILAEHLLG